MSIPTRPLGRILSAAGMGLASVAACAGAAPAGPEAQSAWTPDADELARRDKAAEDAGAPADDAAPRCPYGELTDPHRGFARCLLPDERDAGWLPPPPQEPVSPEPPKAGADGGGPEAAPPPKVSLPVVEVGAPKFENGEVPKAEKAINGVSAEIAKCIAEHGGLSGAAGTLKVQFLVRARGRAEGVEVLSAKGV